MPKDTTNTDMVAFQSEVFKIGIPKINHKDKNALDLIKLRTDEYYHICAKYNMMPTWAGLALAIGINRVTLSNWKEGVFDWVRGDIQEFINQQWAFLNSYHESGMLEGMIPTVPGIFIGKNNFGYINEDRETVVHEISTHWSAEQLIEGAKNLQIDLKK